MLQVDLHSHSHFSLCGIHSVVEMLAHAKAIGLKGLAITDHGPAIGGRTPSTFFDRLFDPVPGIRLLKGMECNLDPKNPGAIDFPARYMPFADVVLLGIHPNTAQGSTPAAYTDLLVAALEKNPHVDIVTHPNDALYPQEFDRLARRAAELNVALEINNSKTALARVGDEVTGRLIRACRDAGCTVAVCSDAHALNEIGGDGAVRPLLDEAGFPESLIVNRTADAAFAWIDRRRRKRQASA